MKTLFLRLLILSLFFISTLSNAQSWTNLYPGSGSINGITDTADGNIIIQSSDGSISKILPSNGNISWTTKVSSNYTEASYTFQSLARVNDRILAVRHGSLVLLDDAGNILLRREYTPLPTTALPSITVCRVKAIDGFFYVLGGLTYPNLPSPPTSGGYSTSTSFIQKISYDGSVIWSKMSKFSFGGPTGIVIKGVHPMYTDVEKLSSGELIASITKPSLPPSEMSVILIDDTTGQEISEKIIYDNSGMLGYNVIATDLSIDLIGNTEVLTVVGSSLIGNGIGQHKTFRVSAFLSNDTVINSSVFTSSQGTPYITYFDVTNTVRYGGFLIDSNYNAKLFANINGEDVVFDETYVNHSLGSTFSFKKIGSNVFFRSGNDFYLGTAKLTPNGIDVIPQLIKKDVGSLFSEITCVTDLNWVNQSISAPYFDNIPIDYINPDLPSMETSYVALPGAIKTTDCCSNFSIDILGNTALCGSGVLTLTASVNSSNNNYSWSGNGVFQNTTNPDTIEVHFSDNTLGYYEFCVEITTSDGCISNECVTVQIIGPIYHTLPSQVCSSDPCVDFLTTGANSGEFTVNGSGVSSYISGPIKYYEFCPSGLSSGIYDIEIINNISGCTTIASIEVIDGIWAKSTSNSFSGDEGVDLDSDANGNVYSLGNFIYETNFENFSLTSLGVGDNNMLLSKIGECGAIDWIATSIEGDQEAVKIDINENLELIYVTGNYNEITTFSPAKLPDGTLACTYNGNNFLETIYESGVYVVIYNFDGCLIDLIEYPNTTNSEFHAQAISSYELDTNSISNRYYLMLRETPLNAGGIDYLRLKAITPNYILGTTIYSEVENWTQSFSSSNEVQVNDMVNHRNKIYFTGFFRRDLFSLGLGAPILYSSGSNPDAFIYGVKDNSVNAGYIFNKELYTDSTEQHYAKGNGITANQHGVFSTGSYKQSVNNPFDSGLFMPSFGINSNSKTAYVLALELNGQFKWLNNISSKNSKGKAITVTALGNVYISGSFRGENMYYQDISAQTSLPILNVSNGGHKFIVNWHADDAFNFSGEWANASTPSKQVNMSITATSDYTYTSGFYLDNMSMLNTTVSPLNSSGNGMNLYLWRYDALNGQSKNYKNLKKTIFNGNDITQKVTIHLYPNPVKDELMINSEQKLDNITIKIFDLMGNMVFMEKFESLTNSNIRLHKINTGLYLGIIEDSNGTLLKNFKIIKE